MLEFIGGSDFDVIIGMDILSCGDIALTNAGGKCFFLCAFRPQTHTSTLRSKSIFYF